MQQRSRKSFLIRDILCDHCRQQEEQIQCSSQVAECQSTTGRRQQQSLVVQSSLLTTDGHQSTPATPVAELYGLYCAAVATAAVHQQHQHQHQHWSHFDPMSTYAIAPLLHETGGQQQLLDSASARLQVQQHQQQTGGDGNGRKVRRNRTVFTELQLMGLERRFDSQKYLSTPDRAELARALQLTQLQVKTWYQNRRMKWKKQVLQTGCSVAPTKPKGRPKKNSIPSMGLFLTTGLCNAVTSSAEAVMAMAASDGVLAL